MSLKKLVALLTILLFFGAIIDSYGQLNRRNIRKNNKRISKFKGKKQNFTKEKKYNSIGITLNALNYFGDLAPSSNAGSTDIAFTRPGFGIDFAHRFGPRYTLRASFLYGTISGDDFESADQGDANARFRYARNLSFRNRIQELSVVAVFDLFKNEASYISRVQWTPYVYLGGTVFRHNPQAYVADNSGLPEAGTWVDLEPLGTEGQYSELDEGDANFGIDNYSLFQFAIPFGIGIRYRLNQVFDLSFEMGMRYTFTDYLDDVSANYVDLGVFQGDNAALARYLSDRSAQDTGAEGGVRNIEDVGFSIVSYQPRGGAPGETVEVVQGFGSEFRDNVRGGKDDNDIYFVTTIRLSYIIGATFTRAKFR